MEFTKVLPAQKTDENMEPISVLVSYPLDPDGSSGEPYGSSGILISEHWVLAHGSLMKPTIWRGSKVLDFATSLRPGEINALSKEVAEALRFRVFRVKAKKASMGEQQQQPVIGSEVEEHVGRTTLAWKCPLVKETLEGVLRTWSFDKFAESNKLLLPVFLLIRLEDPELADSEVPNAREVLARFLMVLAKPERGLVVEIESTPFGNPVFIESIARGVVSNVIGTGRSVILTDANAVPGCEGGPVYVRHESGSRSICGMVIAPLSWCRGEWVDYTFVANLLPCLRQILREPCPSDRINKRNEEPKDEDTYSSQLADLLDRSLMVVKCGSGWGTGILLDRKIGTILTCSHVVKEAPGSRIKVLQRGDRDHDASAAWATLVYRTPDGKPYDVAVLNVEPKEVDPLLRGMPISSGPVLRGEAAASAGFPFFSTSLPTITRGNVSRSSACMIQTTCCVQSGASGGPVVRWPTGEMLGMVVCNAISSATTALYPRLNMAVPASVLKEPLEEYVRSGDPKTLRGLESDDAMVRQMWNLYLLPSSKI